MNIGYIKIALALLSVAGYVQNIAFASDSAPASNPSNEESKHQLSIDPEEAKQQLSIDPEEAKQAADVMADALALAQEHAQNTNDYELYYKKDDEAILYFKNFKNTVIGKLELIVPNPDSYDGIINMLMDPNGPKKIYKTFTDGTLSRIYDPNLLIVRQQYKSIWGSWQRHFYGLVNKVESSEDETAIIMVSLDVNDYNNRPYKIHVNPIVESANLFKPNINSQEDIRNKESKKMYINLVTFFIKKEENCVKVTFVGSIDMNAYSRASQQTLRKIAAEDILLFAKLRNIFKKE